MYYNNQREIADGMDGLIQMINDGNERRWENMLRTMIAEHEAEEERKTPGH